MKLKHNKKRNTAFLYESLVAELTKAGVKNDAERKRVLTYILKEHFSRGTVLTTELELYKSLKDTHHLDPYTAERLISETKTAYNSLDKEDIFEKQSALIESINKVVGKGTFSNFVPNYKTLASISQIFNQALTPKEKVLLERSLMGRLTSKPTAHRAKEKMVHIDNLVYKRVVETFNQKYDGQLLEEQRELLNKYILSLDNSFLELRVHLNEEMTRIKEQLVILQESEEFKQDQEMNKKLINARKLIENFQTKKVDAAMIEKLLRFQGLIAECNN